MSDMKDVNLVFRDREKNPVLVLPAAVKSLTYFGTEKLAFRCQRTALGVHFQRANLVVQAIEPAVGGFRLALGQPSVRFGDVLLCGKFNNDAPPPHPGRWGILCLARISSRATRNGLPVPSFIDSSPR